MQGNFIHDALKDSSFYLVDFNFEKEFIVFASSKKEHFLNSLQVRAQDFPLEDLVKVSFADFFNCCCIQESEPKLNYLFHLPFCGSSILTKYLEYSTLLIRDPVSLYALYVRNLNKQRYPSSIIRLRKATLEILNSRFDGDKFLIRTAGSYPHMIKSLVRSRTFKSGIFLYADPEFYLAQVLKSPRRRVDIRALFAIDKQSFVKKRSGKNLTQLPDYSVAALSWLYTMEAFLNLPVSKKQQMRSLNSSVFFQNEEDTVLRICNFLQIENRFPDLIQKEQIQSKHIKTGKKYSINEHKTSLSKAYETYNDEIKFALEFLDNIIPISQTLSDLKEVELK